MKINHLLKKENWKIQDSDYGRRFYICSKKNGVVFYLLNNKTVAVDEISPFSNIKSKIVFVKRNTINSGPLFGLYYYSTKEKAKEILENCLNEIKIFSDEKIKNLMIKKI